MIAIAWILIGAVLLGIYNALLIKDGRLPLDDPKKLTIEGDWHYIGGAIFAYLSATAYSIWGWKYIPFALSCFWAIFAGLVHTIALDKPFFFVGTTAKTDKLLQKWFPNKAETASGVLKISMLVVSILLIFLL